MSIRESVLVRRGLHPALPPIPEGIQQRHATLLERIHDLYARAAERHASLNAYDPDIHTTLARLSVLEAQSATIKSVTGPRSATIHKQYLLHLSLSLPEHIERIEKMMRKMFNFCSTWTNEVMISTCGLRQGQQWQLHKLNQLGSGGIREIEAEWGTFEINSWNFEREVLRIVWEVPGWGMGDGQQLWT